MADQQSPVTSVASTVRFELPRLVLALGSEDLARMTRALDEGRSFEVPGQDCIVEIERNRLNWLKGR